MNKTTFGLIFVCVLALFGCVQRPVFGSISNVEVSIELAAVTEKDRIPVLVTVTNNRVKEICISTDNGLGVYSSGSRNEFSPFWPETIYLPQLVELELMRVMPNETVTLLKSFDPSGYSAPTEFLRNLDEVTLAFVQGFYRCAYKDDALVTSIEVWSGIDVEPHEQRLGTAPRVTLQAPLSVDVRRAFRRH